MRDRPAPACYSYVDTYNRYGNQSTGNCSYMYNCVPIPTTYVPKTARLSPNENIQGNRQVDSGNYGGEYRKI